MSARGGLVGLACLRGRIGAPIATLTVVAFLATFLHPRTARAIEDAQPAGTTNFADQSNGAKSGNEDATSKARKTKARKAPVSAKGSFGTSVAIQVQPGRLGMTPSLGLSYDSGSISESPVGVGWSFGPTAISRSTRLGFPKVEGPDGARSYRESAAIFTGPSGEMVPAADGPAGASNVFQPMRESSAARFERDLVNDGWIEHVPSGTKRYYGHDPFSARRGRITNELGTHAWLLVREQDAHFNYISYEYHNASAAERADKRAAQRTPVLKRVEWGGTHPTQSSVFFAKTTIAPQVGPANLLEGNTILEDKITRIEVGQIVGSSDVVDWLYDLGYTTSETGKQLLRTVSRGGDAPETQTFTYSVGLPAGGPRFEEGSPLGTAFDESYVDSAAGHFVWEAAFLGVFDNPVRAAQAPYYRAGLRLIDVDGNGTTDALYHGAGVGISAAHVLWEHSLFQSPSTSGLGAWSVPPLGNPNVPSAQPTTGLPFFPYQGDWARSDFPTSMIRDLADIDGDGDADGVSLAVNVDVTPGRSVALVDPPPPHFDPMPSGLMRFRFMTNSARPGPVAHATDQIVDNWPTGADLHTRVVAGTTGGPGGGDPYRYKPEVQSDVLAPVIDLNADGKSDVVLIKQNTPRVNWRPPLAAGAVFGVAPAAMARMYSNASPQDPGEYDDLPFEQEVQNIVTSNVIVLVGEDLMRSQVAPGPRGRVWTTAARLGVPELPPDQPMVLFMGGPPPGTPGWPPTPESPWPAGPPEIRDPAETPWWMPRVDPDGDVWLPLRDHWYLRGGYWGFTLFGGNYRYTPRVYLMRGGETRGVEPEPQENSSQFERSLQALLNKGSPDECLSLKCAYHPHVNFNSLLVDLNSDGLPDLVSATPPRTVPGGGGGADYSSCAEGHRVHLNRGYTFETLESETLAQAWSEVANPSSALRLLANRDRLCDVTRPRIDDDVSLWALGVPKPTYPPAAMAQADLDGDGRVDLVFAYQSAVTSAIASSHVFRNTGRGFQVATGIEIPNDVAIARNIELPFELNTTGRNYWPRAVLPDMARFADLDNDGLPDILLAGFCRNVPPFPNVCTAPKWYHNRGNIPDRLERIDSTDGGWTTIEYASPKASALTIAADGMHPAATTRFVKKVRSASGPESAPLDFPVEEIRFSYENYVKDLVSNEVLGFEKVKAEFVNSFNGGLGESVLVTRTFDVRPEVLDGLGNLLPVRHPLKGALVATTTESGGWTANELVEYSAEPLGSGVRIRPRLEIHGDTSPTAASAWFAEQTLAWDAYGNPTEEVSGDWDGAAITAASARTELTEYENRATSAWQIGLVTRVRNFGYSEDIAGTPDPAHLLGEVTTSYYPSGAVQSSTRVGIRGGTCAGADDDTTTYDVGSNGLVLVVHESNGRDRTTVYDAKKLHPSTVTTTVPRWVDGVPTGGVTTMTASYTTDLRTGKPTTVMDPNGSAIFSTFDSEGRLLERRGPDNTLLESNVYADSYPLSTTSTITTDTGKTFQRKTQLDADGHVLSVVEGAGTTAVPWSRKSKTRFDAFGREIESYLPELVATINDGALPSSGPKDVTVYDGFDRPTQVWKADGTTTSTVYQPRETMETNARSIPTLRIFDAFGELVEVQRNPGGAGTERSTHSFVRDGRGEILQVIDGDGSVRRFERDGAGRLLYVTLPATPGNPVTQFSMCHDLDDGLVRLESASGRVVEITRDTLGRVVLTHASDLNGLVIDTTQSYDDPLVAKGKGRLTRKVDESGAYNLTYDSYGRPSQLTFAPSARAKAGATNVAASYAATFAYSVAGHLKTATVSSGLPKTAGIVYTRDVKGRATMIESKVASTAKIMAVDIAHDADDRVVFARYGNGTTGEWTFNALSERLDRVAYKNGAGGVLAAVNYVYDPNGNPLEENREREGYGGIYSFKLHSYDALDRVLQSISSSPAGYFVEDHTFSAGGNILTAGGDAYAYASDVTSQAVTQVVNATAGTQRDLAYDLDGYLATDSHVLGDGSTSSRTLAFDPTGCMRSITRVDVPLAGPEQTSSSDYTCGLDGRVVARATTKADGSTARRIDFAGLGEIRPDDGVFVLRIPLSGAVAVEDARSLATGNRVTALAGYQAHDVRGSVIASTTLEDTSTLAKEAEFDAWGKKLGEFSTMSSPRRGFAGAEADEAVGTYSFGARSYDPSLRRWLSPDPLVGGAPEVDEDVGDDLNLYAYTGNNPVRRTDLSGFFGEELRRDAMSSKPVMGALGFVMGVAQGVVPGLSLVKPPDVKESPYSGTFYHNLSAGQMVGAVVSARLGQASGGASMGAAALKSVPVAVMYGTVSAAYVGNAAIVAKTSAESAKQAQASPDGTRTAAPKGEAKKADTAGAKSGTVGRGKAQERLKEIAKDPNTPKSQKGWIKQEQNRITRGQAGNIRNPPGKELAHARGREAAKGFDHKSSPSKLQDKDLHRTQHKIDKGGKLNKLRP